MGYLSFGVFGDELGLTPSFENRILPVSHAIADRWAVLSMRLERKGKPLPLFDGLMAATALHHDLTVVTRNAKDFVDFDVPILNPWERS
jgi:predicted nucleic acid-binding protein